MRARQGRSRLAAAALLLVLAGCGGAAQSPGTTGKPDIDVSSADGKPTNLVLDVTIIDKEVKPRGARVNLKVGQKLTLVVHSDMDAEIHVHTEPEHEFAVKAGVDTRLTFSSDRPGKVAVEVHQLDAVIAEVLVTK